MFEQELYETVLVLSAAVNVALAGGLMLENVFYRDYEVYRRSRMLTALTMFFFGVGFFLHYLLEWRSVWPAGASALSVTYFHVGGVLFSWSHTSLLNPAYLTKKIVRRDLIILIIGVATYWQNAVAGIAMAGFSIFFVHAAWLSYVLYGTLLRVRRQLHELPMTDSNSRWWTEETRASVFSFQASIQVSCYLIVLFGLGSVAVTAFFSTEQWPFTMLLCLGMVVFCYIFYELNQYGMVVEAGTNATEDVVKLQN